MLDGSPGALRDVATQFFIVCAVSNNGATKNFQVLLYHTLAAVSACEKHEAKATAAANALYLARMLFQHFSESLNAVQLAVFSTDNEHPATDITPGASWSESICIGSQVCSSVASTAFRHSYCPYCAHSPPSS